MPRGTLKSSLLLAGTLGTTQGLQAKPLLAPPSLRGPQEPAEASFAMMQTVRAYLEAWTEGDAEAMLATLHPDLASSILELDEAGQGPIRALARTQGIRASLGPTAQDDGLTWQVTVLGTQGRSASVRAMAGRWCAFLHLSALADRWAIVHVLWDNQTPLRA